MSALLTKGVEAAARAAECTGLFAKPFEVDELIGKVRTAVGDTRL
jgi:hypothetical protein